MAGHRRRNKPGQPLQRTRNVQRRREEYQKTLAGATTEKERTSAAWNHLRSALAALANRSPAAAEAEAKTLRADLEELAERLWRQVLSTRPRNEEK